MITQGLKTKLLEGGWKDHELDEIWHHGIEAMLAGKIDKYQLLSFIEIRIEKLLSQMEEAVREEVIEDFGYFADGNFIESMDGAIKKKMVALDDLHIILESLKKGKYDR